MAAEGNGQKLSETVNDMRISELSGACNTREAQNDGAGVYYSRRTNAFRQAARTV